MKIIEKIRRYILWPVHYLIGFISGFIWFIDKYLAIFLYIQFFLYELVEEEKKHDQMYIELREFTAGFVIGMIVFLLNHIFKLW